MRISGKRKAPGRQPQMKSWRQAAPISPAIPCKKAGGRTVLQPRDGCAQTRAVQCLPKASRSGLIEWKGKHGTQTGSFTDRLRGPLVRKCSRGVGRRCRTRYFRDDIDRHILDDDNGAGPQRLRERHWRRPRSEQRRQHPEVTPLKCTGAALASRPCCPLCNGR